MASTGDGWSARFNSYMHLSIDLAREMLIIIGTWLVFAFFIAATIYGVFYVLGMRQLDLLLILWASVIASSIFAIPYEDHWGLKRFRVLFGVTACLVITSFLLLTVGALAQNLLTLYISSGYLIPAIFISGFILAIFTRDYWSIEKLQSIKNLTLYAIIGESLLLAFGEAIAGMENVDPWVRGLFLVVVCIIIAISGYAIIKLMADERKPY
jgi:hypothetical protein